MVSAPSVTRNAYSLPPATRCTEPGTTRAPTFTPTFVNEGSALSLAASSVGVRYSVPVSLIELAIKYPATASTTAPPIRNLLRGFMEGPRDAGDPLRTGSRCSIYHPARRIVHGAVWCNTTAAAAMPMPSHARSLRLGVPG